VLAVRQKRVQTGLFVLLNQASEKFQSGSAKELDMPSFLLVLTDVTALLKVQLEG
jgi:hypothetical protein